jgi:RNA polymerase sigma-70 factor, ECF subfamily
MSTIDFASLYERYAADVRHFALYLTGDRREADDIVAETFVRAWIATGEIRMATVKAYLLSIARNLHIERHRQRGRMTALTAELPDPSVSPERATGSRGELQAVLRALQAMPEVDRSAVLMRARDVSYADIALALGISSVAARVKVHRARMKLVEMGFGRSERT